METVYELLKKNADDLRKLVRTGVEMEDVANIPLFEEYVRLEKDGLKHAAIFAYLADQYSRSDRTIQRIVSKFKRNAPDL